MMTACVAARDMDAQQSFGPYTVYVQPQALTMLTGHVLIEYLGPGVNGCIFLSSGTWTVTTAPVNGIVSTQIDNSPVTCVDGQVLVVPYNDLYYTWTSTSPEAKTDYVAATWTAPQSNSESYSFNIYLACPAPTITSVSPNIWFAGQTYNNVTITGANFVTTTAATAACPATTVTLTTPSNANVGLGTVTVNSPTQITIATVTPPSSETTEGATITVSGATPATVQADFLGAPQIQWNGNTISGSGAQTQSTIVGQNVVLTTTPTATTLAALPVPLTFYNGKDANTQSSWTPWTLTGTNIGNYTASTASASVTPTDLSQPNLNTYWVVPKKGVSVTYEYCVNTPSQDDLCPSTPATANATFNVSGGGKMASEPYKQLTIDQLIQCVNGKTPKSGGVLGPSVVYGKVTGNNCGEINLGSDYGMTLTPSAAPSGGKYSYVQLINSDDPMSVDGNTSTGCSSTTPGIDRNYPYQGIILGTNPPQAEDAPGDSLESGYIETRTFNATMFLMWTPPAAHGAATIPVPIGYQTWGFSGGASQNDKKAWVATTNGTPGPIGDYTPSNGQTQAGPPQMQDGYPIWSGVATCN